MSKKIIVFYSSNLDKRGGIQTVIRAQLRLWNKYNIKCEYIATGYVFSVKRLISVIRNLKKTLKKEDVLYAHGFSSVNLVYCIILSLLLRRRFIWHPHYHPFSHHNSPLKARIFFYIVGFWFGLISLKIVAITPSEKLFFEKIYFLSENKIKLIPNFITKKNDVFEQDKSNICLFIGRNDNNKQLRLVIDNVDLLLSKNLHLKVITNEYLVKEDRIDCYINVEDRFLQDLYSRAKYILIPSKYEAFSMVFLEAIVNGVIPIVSRGVMITDFSVLSGLYILSDFKKESLENNLVTDICISQERIDRIKLFFGEENAIERFQSLFQITS